MIIVVMKGWPFTAARVLLSLRICSTCFSRMTIPKIPQKRLTSVPFPFVRSEGGTDMGHHDLTVGFPKDLESKDFAFVFFRIATRQGREPHAGKGS